MKQWSEFKSLVKPNYSRKVWIPVYLMLTKEVGRYPNVNWSESFEGVHSLVVSQKDRHLGDKYDWSDDNDHSVWAGHDQYIPADEYWHTDEERVGFRLVIRQVLPDRNNEFHLHQDFVVALGLVREGDVWVRPAENYVEVARLVRNDSEVAKGIEIKSEYLSDYLAARNSLLRISTYRSQQSIVSLDEIPTDFSETTESFSGGELEFRRMDVDGSGDEAGTGVAVMKVSRSEFDDEDVPELVPESEQNTTSESWSFTRGEAVAARLMADYWRNEWFEPANSSLRVRRDKIPSEVSFIVEANGQKLPADSLDNEDVGRWLWFEPSAILSLSQRRGAQLSWYSRDTGGISTPSDPAVHFGVNGSGLVTVYAADIARLPEWERRFWAGSNVTPEGGVCAELLEVQVKVNTPTTQAPEKFLPIVITQFREAWAQKFGSEILIDHANFSEIVAKCHRFRAIDQHGLFALAKDIARISADLIDVKVARAECPDDVAKTYGSLKALECAIASLCGTTLAHKIVGPLFATYDLRLQDAHPPRTDISRAYETLQIDSGLPAVLSGMQMVRMAVLSFDSMRRVLEGEIGKP